MKRLPPHQRQTVEALLWMLPALLLVLFATIYPLFFSIDYSLYRTSIFKKIEFVGLDNYINLFTDERFKINVTNSLVFTFVGIAITYVLDGDGDIAFMLPAFFFDGEAYSDIKLDKNALSIAYNGYICRYITDGSICGTGAVCANRNGHYKAYFASGNKELSVKIEIFKGEAP